MLYRKIRHYIVSRLNALIKKTNWWKNKFVFTTQFTGANYRDNLTRNLQIVNVGSNSARFCFFYESVLGQNWSTGTQGLSMDYEILRYHFSYLGKNGIVLLPLSPFSFCSSYLRGGAKEGHYTAEYYLKYTSILDYKQIEDIAIAKDIWGFLHSPIRYNRKAWKYLINDEEPDRRLEITDQHMMLADLEHDADIFMAGWKAEFDIKDLSTSLPEHLLEAREKSVAILAEMIDFLLQREYRPVIVLPPMTSVLYNRFPASFWQTYIYDGLKKLNRPNVPVLDYLLNEKWQNTDLYFNSLFMNLRGRKAFTKQVLKDVGLEK